MARRGDVMESAATRAPRAKKAPPFPFVLDALASLAPTCRPMFGCTAVYVGPRIVLILRQRGDADDGVWVATTHAHHASLRAELPSLRSIAVFGAVESAWQNLPADGARFEDEVMRACALVCAGDGRVGRLPAGKKRAATTEALTDAEATPELRLPRKKMLHPEAMPAARRRKGQAR